MGKKGGRSVILRELKQEDRLALRKLWSICYQSIINVEEVREKLEASADEIIGNGAFTEDGELMSGMLSNRLMMNFDGAFVPLSGVGGVATHPAYRFGGSVRAVTGQLLARERAHGCIFSGLYPFNHAFYRKFGYELAVSEKTYTLPVRLLKPYAGQMQARLLQPEDDRSFLKPVFDAFIACYNLAVACDEKKLAAWTRSEPYARNEYTYVLYNADAPVACLHFEKLVRNGEGVLSVKNFAFTTEEGFRMLLGFLYRFDAEMHTLEIKASDDIPLAALIDTPYEVQCSVGNPYMLRALNTEEVLKAMRRGDFGRFVIEVADDFLPDNAGRWLVEPGKAEPTQLSPDLRMSVQAFSQLVCGYTDLASARFRRDVEILTENPAPARAFAKKPLYVGYYY